MKVKQKLSCLGLLAKSVKISNIILWHATEIKLHRVLKHIIFKDFFVNLLNITDLLKNLYVIMFKKYIYVFLVYKCLFLCII